MEEVIDLSSDSNESFAVFNDNKLSEINEFSTSIKKSTEIRPAHYLSDDDDFNFPVVPFCNEVEKQNYDTESEPLFIPNAAAYKSDNNNIEEMLLNKYLLEQPISKTLIKSPEIEKKKRKMNNKNGLTDNDKEILKIQKLKNAEEAAKKKAEKKAISERLKSMKPGECMKYMKVILDSNFQDLEFSDNLIKELQNFELEYHLKSQIISNSITWKRKLQEKSQTNVIEENQILIIWDYKEAVKRVSDLTFVASIGSVLSLLPGKKPTLVIYGMENYFKHHKNLKKMQIKNQTQENFRDLTKHRGSKTFQHLPIISKKELDSCLTEIQFRMKCHSHLIETPQQLGLLVNQYTKSIAEAPFKIHKNQSSQGQLDWYSAADNKDTVRVDKDGNGLKRLWQQQLCQFNLAKLETAEAIISQYPTPVHLMEAYALCSPSEGAKLLQDIAIRRTAGPLTAVRKIGPELSKKLHLMFTTEDGNILLGNEEES